MSEASRGATPSSRQSEDFLASGSPEASPRSCSRARPGWGRRRSGAQPSSTREARGLTVLQAQPVESETTLSFAGIGDLLDPFLDEVLDGLAPVQRRALEQCAGARRGGGAGTRPACSPRGGHERDSRLAAERPGPVAIDDSQWLDFASSAALAYGVRRFRTERVGLLLSRRSVSRARCSTNSCARRPVSGSPGSTSTRSTSQLSAESSTSISALLFRDRSSPRCTQASGGNPFYALEIVRMLQRTGVSIEAGQPLPLPESLHDLVHGRVLALRIESRDFLLAAAAHAHPTITITEAASGISSVRVSSPRSRRASSSSTESESASRIRCSPRASTKPPLRFAVSRSIAALPSCSRIPKHERGSWPLGVDRARRVRRGRAGEAAEAARARGALRPAALAPRPRSRAHARRSSPRRRSRRAVDAAFLHFEAGDARRAEAQLRELLAPLAPGFDARESSGARAHPHYEAPVEAREFFSQVVEEARTRPRAARGSRTKVSPHRLYWLSSDSTSVATTLTSLWRSRARSATMR